MQYPGVVCGLILGPLDAWLFAQINAGNCLSLALNQGYGWAGNVNLRFIFDRLFSVERGAGYPAHRKEPQREGRQALELVSLAAHKPFAEIVTALPAAVAGPSAAVNVTSMRCAWTRSMPSLTFQPVLSWRSWLPVWSASAPVKTATCT